MRTVAFMALAFLAAFAEASQQSVVTTLKGRWTSTPWLLELAEFLNGENPEAFWSLMDHLADEPLTLDSKAAYGKVMEWVSAHLTSAQIKLLKFGLSLRVESPKIQMFQQIALDFGVDKAGCEAVVQNPANAAVQCIQKVDDLQAFASKEAFSLFPGPF